jgi:L-arabinokinase
MGGIADYSGSLVLEMPIRDRAQVTGSLRFDGVWTARSAQSGKLALSPFVSAKTQDLFSVESARAFFKKRPKDAWAAYVLGSVPFLIREKKILPGGADLTLHSDVPLAKGLSSSAAIEVAALSTLTQLYGLRFKGTELPKLSQRVENLVAGAPCGLMDQLTCWMGKKDRLLPILCQPDKVLAPLAIPRGIHFIGVDSGVRHWVGGASYTDVRTAAFMGYSLIALRAGARRRDLELARETGNASRLPFKGYLANISPSLFDSRFAQLLPREMKGRDFLAVAPSIDPVTRVDPKRTYRVLAATRHPVLENQRVRRFRDLLSWVGKAKGEKRKGLLWEAGLLMAASHESYGACGLGEPVTDALVRAARLAGPLNGIHGAKITGGGSGGTVCLMVEGEKGVAAAGRVAQRVLGRKPFIAVGSSEGGRWG